MSIIDDIKGKISILDMCGMLNIAVDRRTMKARSFVNNDSNPSMRIYVKNDRFKDYSSDLKGDVIDMYAAFHRIDKKRAVSELAKVVGTGEYTRTTEHRPAVQHISDDWTTALSADERYFYDERMGMGEEEWVIKKVLRIRRVQENAYIFREMQSYCLDRGWNSAAYRYLTDIRRLPAEALKRFGIFSIDNYNELNNHLKKHFTRDDLLRSGLYRLRDDGQYNLSFFSYRIIIPYTWRGEIIYLRGRYFDAKGNSKDPEGKASKYLGVRNDSLGVNTPKRFYNSDVIAKLNPREVLYMTEGELDTIAIESMGFNSIAVPGVGNVPADEKWNMIRGLTVKLVLDKDAPGQKLQTVCFEKLTARGNRVFEKGLGNYKDANEWLAAHGR